MQKSANAQQDVLTTNSAGLPKNDNENNLVNLDNGSKAQDEAVDNVESDKDAQNSSEIDNAIAQKTIVGDKKDDAEQDTETSKEGSKNDGKSNKILFPPKTISYSYHPLYPSKIKEISATLREDNTDLIRSQMLYLSINNATNEELKRMAKIYNTDESIGDLKSFLLDKMGVNIEKINNAEGKEGEKPQTDGEPSDRKYSFSINNADVIERTSINGTDFIYIDGNVSIEFDVSGSKRVLKADSILYDTSKNEILAFGNISISTASSNSQLQNIKADGLFLNFNSNKIRLTGATGSTQRSNSTYYMSGEEITLDSKSGEIYFKDGALLPNDDVNNANWRIASKDIIMKNNGDLFLSGILLKVGRVPILPLPALFMPAKPLVFNPAIGFASDKGAFINTTYELYGEYPNLGKAGEGNSLTNLFKSSSNARVRKNGILYEVAEGGEKSTSENYMALFADIYQKEGLFLGLDSKNKFPQQNISLDALGGIAYRPQSEPDYITSTTYNNFRYLLDLAFKVSYLGIDGQLNLPFYSDPGAKNSYLNRFTGFSFDSIFAANQKFPETYSSLSGNEFQLDLNLSYSLPSKWQTKYLNSLTLKSALTHTRYWNQDRFSDDKHYHFISSSTTLPSFSASASGTLFSFTANSKTNKEITKAANAYSDSLNYTQRIENELIFLRDEEKNNKDNKDSKDNKEKEENSETGENSKEEIKEEKKQFKFDDKRYSARASLSNSYSNSQTFFTGSNISLKYTLSDTFSNIFQEPKEAKKILGERRTNNSLSGTFTLSGGIGNNIFSFTENIKPTYSYKFQQDSKNLETHELVISSSTSANISYLGLGYNLGMQLFSYKSTKDDDTQKKVTEDVVKFNKEHINTHNLSFSKTFNYVGLSLSGNLPPLSLSFNPRISFRMKGFDMWLMHTIKGENFNTIDNYQTEGKASYSNSYISTSATVRYDWEQSKQSNDFLRPFKIDENFSLTLLDSWIRFSQSLSFLGVTSAGDQNYFQSINFSFSTKNNYFALNMILKGVYNALDLNTTTFTISLPTFTFAFWKNRIVTTLGFVSRANLDFKDAYQNSLSYSLNLKFEIKEFIELSFSLDGENNNFTKYTGGSRNGRFNFGEFLLDILRGLNIFNVSDMITSNFKMSGLNVRAVHDMGDWDLNFEFRGTFEASGNEYKFVPKYTVTLKWKVIPELKVDKTITL